MLPKNETQPFIPYASKADPEMIQPVPEEYQEQGVKPLDSLPAQYWNWMWNTLTTQFNLSITTVTSILTELQNVLKLAGIVPDAAKEDQLAGAIKKLTSDVIGDFADLDFSSDDVKTVVDALNALYDTIKNDIDKRLAVVETDVAAINSKIPDAASATNKLVDEAFVLRHVATNTANFRGEWQTWDDVPTNANQYPVDYSGNHEPTENDYMTVRDASEYDSGTDAGEIDEVRVTRDLDTILNALNTNGSTSGYDDKSVRYNIDQCSMLSMNGAIELAHAGEAGKPYAVLLDNVIKSFENEAAQATTLNNLVKSTSASNIKTNVNPINENIALLLQDVNAVSDTLAKIKADVEADTNNASLLSGLILVVAEIQKCVAVILLRMMTIKAAGDDLAGMFISSSAYKGPWQFQYTGKWSEQGKAGWHPQFALDNINLDDAQMAAINSGVTANKISKLDDNGNYNGSVPAGNISGTIGTSQIADGAVTTAKVANKAITKDKIADGVIPDGGGGAKITYGGTEYKNLAVTSSNGVVTFNFS